MLTISIVLIAAFCVALAGPLTIYLGYKLLIMGIVSNQFNFTANLKGIQLAIAGSCPGLVIAALGSYVTTKGYKFLAKLILNNFGTTQNKDKEI